MMKIKSLKTRITATGYLQITLQEEEVPLLKPGEVLVKIWGAPVNPSDLYGVYRRLEQQTFETRDKGEVMVALPQSHQSMITGQDGDFTGHGNEGSGVVVDAGGSASARALLGKKVGIRPGYLCHV